MPVTLGVLSLCAALAAPSAAPAPAPGRPTPVATQTKPAALSKWTIRVSAGPVDRANVAVRAAIGTMPAEHGLVVRDDKGAPVPHVLLPNGTVAFQVKSLKAGSQSTFTAEQTAKPARAEKTVVQAVEMPEGIKVTVNGKPVVTQVGQPKPPSDVPAEFARSGYLHPLVSPAGVVVTGDYPAGKPNQHGIWSGWSKVHFDAHVIDFWDPSRKQGRVARETTGPVASGSFLGWYGAHQYFTDLGTGSTVLREGWEVTVHRPQAGQRYNLVDLESTTQPMQGRPVTLQASPLGGIFLRGNSQWQGAAQSVFLSSEGTARAAAQGAAARWIYLGGKVAGKQAGVAILASPKNAQGPQAAYVDAEDPVLGFAPAYSAPIKITEAKPLRLAYRFVVLDGPPDAKLFEQLWKDYANPPQVQVSAQ